MAPIRRYLRISKYSVLECRIYLENPSDTRWLLDSRDPVLPRVFAAIRPLVLPKLREENERLWSRKKSKPVKDTISEDEFEVAIFLRESRTRHSLLTRHKTFQRPGNQKASEEVAKIEIGMNAAPTSLADAEVIIESDSEPHLDLRDIPQAGEDDEELEDGDSRQRKTGQAAQGNIDDARGEEKKLGFSTNYESFNICGQPLMEEWISTQAQSIIDEE